MTPKEDAENIKKWLLEEIAGTITPEEKARLEQWAAASPEHQSFKERILSKSFLMQAVTDENKAKCRKSWQELYYRIGYTRTLRLSFRRWGAIAATLCLLFGAAFYLANKEIPIYAGSSRAFLQAVDSTYVLEGEVLDYARYILETPHLRRMANTDDTQCRKIIVPRGGEFKILLEDSTFIHLGPESVLTIPNDYSRRNRRLAVAGEAYFTVHKDSLHPLCIHAEDIDIHVRGTELNIESYPDEAQTSVTLVCGKADLVTADGTARMELPVGGTGVFSAGKGFETVSADIAECTAWHHNRWIFEDRPISHIMKKLARWYNVEVDLTDEEAGNFRITMNMDKYETFNKLAATIRKMNELHIGIKRENKVIISKK